MKDEYKERNLPNSEGGDEEKMKENEIDGTESHM